MEPSTSLKDKAISKTTTITRRKKGALSLSGKVSYITFGKALASLSSLIAGVILSRYLTKQEYGTYRQLWLIYNTVTPLLVLGLPSSINYFIPQLKRSEQQLFNFQTFTILTFGGLIFSSTFFFAAPLIAKVFHNPDLVLVSRLFALIPVLTLPTLYYSNLFICLNKPKLVSGLSSLLAFIRLTAVAFPVFKGYGISGVLIGLTIFSAGQFIIVSYLMFRPFGWTPGKWTFELFKQQIHYAVPFGIARIIGTLTLQIDKIIISTMFTASQYAIYANGAIEIPLIGVITGSVTAVLMPEFVRLNSSGDTAHLIQLWHRAIRKVALIIFPVMILLLIYAPEFLTLLFSAKYADSASIFRIYLLALPNRITTFGTILLSIGLPNLVLRYSVMALILNLLLSYPLVMTNGLNGPAIGTVITIYFIGFIQLRKIAEVLNKCLSNIFPWNTLGKILILTTIAGLLSIWPKYFFSGRNNNLMVLLLGLGTYSLVYVFGGVGTRIMHEEWLVLLSKLRRRTDDT